MLLKSLEKKEANCFVFCDFSKAFDKVWHRGLLHKMKAYGITGNLINWLKSYLKARRQIVIRNNSSAYCEISAGGPHNSVLEPLLFIIYINDIADKLISLSRLFADDTSFCYSNQDTMQLKNVIAHDLNEMDIWSKTWLMSFNPDKTEIMIFCNRSVPENLDFFFNGKSVPITTSHKHLGVTFSNDAKWNNHVDNIKSSVSKHLNILRKLKYRLSRTNLDKLYLVYIRPIAEYACELWDNCGIGNSQKLEQLQLEAARVATGLPIYSILYRETGWELLSARRKLQLFYNIVNKNTPNYLCTLILPTIQRTAVYPLRNGNDIILPLCRLSSTSNSFIPSTRNKSKLKNEVEFLS
jgi:hypothetical protein